VEVRTAARTIQRFGRTYLAYKKLQDMMESDDPELTPAKKREVLQKILHPNKYGKGKLGLTGKRRRIHLTPAKVKGDGSEEGGGEAEYMEMPRFQVTHEGWLNVRVGRLNKSQKCYVSLKQGTLTLFNDHESLDALISYNLAFCALDGYQGRSKGGDDSADAKKAKKAPKGELRKLHMAPPKTLPPVTPPPGKLRSPRDRIEGTPAAGVPLGSQAETIQEEQEDAAAQKLQAVSRGRMARKEMDQQQKAATKVQAVARGHSSRAAQKYEEDSDGDVEVRPARSAQERAMRPFLVLLGLRSEGSCWGFRPCDFGLSRCIPSLIQRDEEWWEPLPDTSGHGHGHGHGEDHGHGGKDHGHGSKRQSLFNMRRPASALHHAPIVRHLWGDPQYELHPGAQELFLDLIFVGVSAACRSSTPEARSILGCSHRSDCRTKRFESHRHGRWPLRWAAS
jgi:hypothetical protein